MSHPEESGRLEFPDLEAEYSREAVHDAASTLREGSIGYVGNGRRADTIMARIRGIDFVERIRVFAAVENRMRGREEVLEALQERKKELEEIGDRDERWDESDYREVQDVDEEEPDPDPVYVHKSCGTVVEQESAMAWFCPECEQRTNRVEEIDPATVDDPQPGVAIADGGGQV